MKIPFTSIAKTQNSATLLADDGYQLEATRNMDGTWRLLDEISSIPKREAHFDLRRQFVNALTGIRP